MRRNIFLHFLNRDTREIFGLFGQQGRDDHFRLLRRSLNAAIILCEDYCTMPPGFAIEDELAFGLAEAQHLFLKARLIHLPIRERNLTEYAEKKRTDYYPMRDRYSGLFDDDRLSFLSRHAEGLVKRKSKITERIVDSWESGPDSSAPIWQPVKSLIPPPTLEIVRSIPRGLMSAESAVTWAAIAPSLPNDAKGSGPHIRNVLQNIYFGQYCDEFDLIAMSGIPFMLDEFHLPTNKKVYCYERLGLFLHAFGLRDVLYEAPAELVVDFKRRAGFVRFIDAYSQLAETCCSRTDLSTRSAEIARDSKFDWKSVPSRMNTLVATPSEFEILELNDAMIEAAHFISRRYNLNSRAGTTTSAPRSTQRIIRGRPPLPEIALFVALDEELTVLSKHFGLERNSKGPAAMGKIGDVDIDVICPMAMGRVAAAVATTRYLQERHNDSPKLILVLGLAGGFNASGIKPGHIICTSTVVDLAQRKIHDTAEGAQPHFRRQDYDMDSALNRVLKADSFKKNEWVEKCLEVAGWPDDRRPAIRDGKLASVDEVVASEAWQKQLLDHTEKLLGVEMEAGGVCAAAKEFKVPVCMLRAVSDNADPSKADDQWRKIGMMSLAELILHTPLAEVLEAI